MPVSIGKWRLFWWYERMDPSEEFEEYDPRWSQQWLRALRANGDSVPALRRFLAPDTLGDLWRLTDEAVVELAGRKLELRRIRVLERKEPFASFRSSDVPGSDPVPFPREERPRPLPSSGPRTPLVDEALFPENAHLVAIAAVLENAARSGTPF